MKGLLSFCVNHYVWFIGLTIFLIFALIGYFVETKQDDRFVEKVEIDKELEARMNVAQATNMTINQMVKANDNVETSTTNEVENPELPKSNEIEKSSSK